MENHSSGATYENYKYAKTQFWKTCRTDGTAAGHGGITTKKKLWFALNTKLPLYLSHLLTVCLQFGEVPDAFRAGVLVPILKKTNIDPGLPKNYRPIKFCCPI